MDLLTDTIKNDSLEGVLRKYKGFHYKPEEKSISHLFNKFFRQDLSHINEWLQNQFSHKVSKDDNVSTKYRQQGNIYYSKQNLKESLNSYTKSICYASPTSEEYSLALANRSAVTFRLGKYEDCLKDIDQCLESKYPQNLRLKVLIRKAECLQKLKKYNDLSTHCEEVLRLFEKVTVKDQDKYIEKLNLLRDSKVEEVYRHEETDSMYKLPCFKEENTDFAYASSKIKARYDTERGRHVIAKQSISKGDLLFLEKAFAFGTIFEEQTRDVSVEKCYHCLKNVFCGIPCTSCVRCVFCDTACRDNSWHQSHRWECEGMQTNIWYHLGIAFPAFRAFLKGITSSYMNKDNLKNECFGNKNDNYPYFNSLVYHIRDNDIETFICSTIVVRYLCVYTDFFPWYLTQPNCPVKDLSKATTYVGHLIAKHILQLENNSSVIEHWTEGKSEFDLPNKKVPVACGIFPSVSIMNHSCKPNIAIYFVCDTIVVKALEDIQINEEVFNCYGIDYRAMGRTERQKYCLSLYNFECNCVICLDPMKEIEMFDSFICVKCGHIIPDNEQINFYSCENCCMNTDINQLREINENAGKLLEDENNEAALLTCLDRRKKYLVKNIQTCKRYITNYMNCMLRMKTSTV
ncbi:hypothetical protein HHI36_019434 [Cryptolaemus montrouzieri]|uniref:Uncharacterized protein n=1 Tax=Cryptolaemus montrouzieri TaxID=559131 RepID=A0ABD2P310_9CUCU